MCNGVFLHQYTCKILKSEKGWLTLKVSLGLKMSFGKTYDQNDSRNEFLDHENIGVYTLIKLVCT